MAEKPPTAAQPRVSRVLAVDGPSGSGKGTLAECLARRLGWQFLDSGALYRIVAHAALQAGLDLGDSAGLSALARRLSIDFLLTDDGVETRVNGQRVDDAVRSDAAGQAASKVAALPAVRSALLSVQRNFRKGPGLVADGRDMGTVVFPDATLKIFLEASPEERALRRYNQLKDKDLGVSLRGLLESIRERDERDRSRAVSPLLPASDAIVVDSTRLSIDEVFTHVWHLVTGAGLDRN